MNMNFGRYSKLIGALAGNAVGVVLVWLAFKFPSIATCAPGPDLTEACTALGFTQAQITAAVLSAFNAAFVYAFPANQPAA